jgi:putative transposase
VTVSRPPQLGVGDEVRCSGGLFTVVEMSGTGVRLGSRSGVETTMSTAQLFTDPAFAVMSQSRAPLPPAGLLEGVPDDRVEAARWWERHVLDVLTGQPADPTVVNRAFGADVDDLARRTMRQREIAKVAELRAAGQTVGLRTFQRIRRRYETDGLWGLLDGRWTRGPVSATGRVDPRVVAAARQAIGEQTNASTGTAARLRRRTEQLLVAEHGLDPQTAAAAMPSRATFYRLVDRLSCGRHTLGSARTRRSLAKRPAGPFGTVGALRPGEWMQIDSSPLNVAAVLDDGLVERVELT